MDNNLKTLLELIKKSQFDEIESISSASVDWDIIYNEAVSQSVIGIVVPELPLSVKGSDEKWSNKRQQILAYNIRYYFAENELTKLLDDANIPFVILKGTAASIYYKHPERRLMGDIDFLVPQEEYENTIKLLTNNGFKREMESHSLRHVAFTKHNIAFELHHHFSHDIAEVEKYIIEGIQFRTYCEICNCYFPMLPNLSNGLVLLDHMRSHLISGLGLRQIIDWMMYVENVLSNDFWENEFSSVVRILNMEKFAKVTTKTCQLYLGLSESITWCKDVDSELCDNLLDLLFEFGNFGCKRGDENSLETVQTQIKRFGLFKWLQKSGEHNWRAYRNHHWLKPLCWLYQIFRYTIQGTKYNRMNNNLTEDIDKGTKRYELLRNIGVVFKK